MLSLIAQVFSLSLKYAWLQGQRWSEAENLEGSQVTPYRITYKKYQKWKKFAQFQSLKNFMMKSQKRGRLFTPCRKTFERVVEKAGIELPEGQCTHVSCHTFCEPLHDERRKHTCFKRDIRSFRYKNDNDLCSLCATTLGGCCDQKSSIKAETIFRGYIIIVYLKPLLLIINIFFIIFYLFYLYKNKSILYECRTTDTPSII